MMRVYYDSILLLLLIPFVWGQTNDTNGDNNGNTCTTPSTLIKTGTIEATYYDYICHARKFRVDTRYTNEGQLYTVLNLPFIQIASVTSYPVVQVLNVSHNILSTFTPSDVDLSLVELDLHANFIAEITTKTVNFPQRIKILDLSENTIANLPDDPAWPSDYQVEHLILNRNPLQSLSASAFTALTSLKELDLQGLELLSSDKLPLPVLPNSLMTLNLRSNGIQSIDSFNFTDDQSDSALTTIDLSDNKLKDVPKGISELTALENLNLEGNRITSISGVKFPSSIQILNLGNNPLDVLEISESQVAFFESLTTFTSPSDLRDDCENPLSTTQTIQNTSFCIVPDTETGSSAVLESGSTSSSESVDSTPIPAVSRARQPQWTVIGLGICVLISVCALFIFAIKWKRRNFGGGKTPRHSQFMGHNSMNYSPTCRGVPRSRRQSSNPYGGDFQPMHSTTWVQGQSPKATPVALLEKMPKTGYDSKELRDLVVFEIPSEEIKIQRPMGSNSMGENPRKFLADYQSFQILLHALIYPSSTLTSARASMHGLTSTKTSVHGALRKVESDFIARIRLCSSLEHACVVQFIGILFDASLHQFPKHLRNNPIDLQKTWSLNLKDWRLAVAFEHMSDGSLAGMFQQNKPTYRSSSVDRQWKWFPNMSNMQKNSNFSASIMSLPSTSEENANSSTLAHDGTAENIPIARISRPIPPPPRPTASTSEGDWRCKLSVALDIAMALAYLHKLHVVHGNLSAKTVYLNEHGDAKLCGMDIEVSANLKPSQELKLSARERITSKMKSLMTFSEDRSRFSLVSDAPVPNSSAVHTTRQSLSCEAIQRGIKQDIYDFGLLLWELDNFADARDTMAQLSSESSLDPSNQLPSSQSSMEAHRLVFSPECPSEVQLLARKCWHSDLAERVDALYCQEELIHVLEMYLKQSAVMNSSILLGNRSVSRWKSQSSNSSISAPPSALQQFDHVLYHDDNQEPRPSDMTSDFLSESETSDSEMSELDIQGNRHILPGQTSDFSSQNYSTSFTASEASFLSSSPESLTEERYL